jgi:hypothetical protein
MHLLAATAIEQKAHEFRLVQAARPLSELGTSHTQASVWQQTRRSRLTPI